MALAVPPQQPAAFSIGRAHCGTNDGVLSTSSNGSWGESVPFWLPSMSSSSGSSSIQKQIPLPQILTSLTEKATEQEETPDDTIKSDFKLPPKTKDFSETLPIFCKVPVPHQVFSTSSESQSAPSDLGEAPSIGSLKHPDACSPCLFWFRNACTKGESCTFCHFMHEGQKNKRIRPSKKTRLMRASMGRDGSGTSGSVNCGGTDGTEADEEAEFTEEKSDNTSKVRL
mmetsp:Transcript_11044/g.25271  ORF Transcript_11044/g.25271 Transcript_11044/m.25271 type:complete len:227 (+) Transcript_11044:131-811(+)